jgi:hypothetical protein
MIFPKIILSNQTPKTPALDFDEHTDTQEYKTTTDDFRKNTNAMTTAMTMIPTVQTDISTLDSNIIEDVCASYGSCDIALPSNVPLWFCNCETLCEVYNITEHNFCATQFSVKCLVNHCFSFCPFSFGDCFIFILNYLLVTFLVPFMFIPMFENTVWPFP